MGERESVDDGKTTSPRTTSVKVPNRSANESVGAMPRLRPTRDLPTSTSSAIQPATKTAHTGSRATAVRNALTIITGTDTAMTNTLHLAPRPRAQRTGPALTNATAAGQESARSGLPAHGARLAVAGPPPGCPPRAGQRYRAAAGAHDLAAALTRAGWAGWYPSLTRCRAGNHSIRDMHRTDRGPRRSRSPARGVRVCARGGNPAARRFPVARLHQDGGGRDAGAADQHAVPVAGLFFPVAAAALVVCGHRRQGLYMGLAAAVPLSVTLAIPGTGRQPNGASFGRARPSTPSAHSRPGRARQAPACRADRNPEGSISPGAGRGGGVAGRPADAGPRARQRPGVRTADRRAGQRQDRRALRAAARTACRPREHRHGRAAVVALWLGHERVSTTSIYLHADMSQNGRAIARSAARRRARSSSPPHGAHGGRRPRYEAPAHLVEVCFQFGHGSQRQRGHAGHVSHIRAPYALVNRGFAARLDSIEVEIMCLPQILDETPSG